MSDARLYLVAGKAVRMWGAQSQLRQLTEECGELVAAVNQYERGRITADQLASEVADVLIMAAQARGILGQLVDAQLACKLDRLEVRLAHALEQKAAQP